MAILHTCIMNRIQGTEGGRRGPKGDVIERFKVLPHSVEILPLLRSASRSARHMSPRRAQVPGSGHRSPPSSVLTKGHRRGTGHRRDGAPKG